MWVDGPRRRPEQVAAGVRALALEMNAIALANEGIGREEPPLPVEGRLHTLRPPTLVVVGEEDTLWTRATADWLLRQLPAARRVDLPDAGHLPNMEQPAAYNAAVLAFLAAGPLPTGAGQ
jgi:pimeloyl-ACP methyl ester carboxylesterase